MSFVKACNSAEAATRMVDKLRTLGYKAGASGITVTVHAAPDGATDKEAIMKSLVRRLAAKATDRKSTVRAKDRALLHRALDAAMDVTTYHMAQKPKQRPLLEITNKVDLAKLKEKGGSELHKAKDVLQRPSRESIDPERDRLWETVRTASKKLQMYPRGAMGLTPDSVKTSLEFRTDKAAYAKADADFKAYMKKSRAKAASPFDRDTDVGAAKIVLRESKLMMSPQVIAKSYGFSVQFVKDVVAGKYGKTDAELQKNLRKAEDTLEPVGDATEKLLYGIRKGNTERYQEELLSTNPARFNEIKQLAGKDGWHSFRVGSVDLAKSPNFAKTVAKDSELKPVGDSSMINVSYKLNGPTAFQVNTSQFVEWARKEKKPINSFADRLKALQEFTGDPRIKDWETAE